MKISKKKGFTLIELLVVIAIITLLSSIILAAFGNARANARTGQRLETLITLRNALELYYTKNGHYPITSSGSSYPIYQSDNNTGVVFNGTNSGNWIPGLVADGDIGALPHDPRPGVVVSGCNPVTWNGPESAVYVYESDDGTGYLLGSVCGAESPINTNNVLYDTWLASYGAPVGIYADNHTLKICVAGDTFLNVAGNSANDCTGGYTGWL